MILYNNLHFFDKYGKNLNLEKKYFVNVAVNRNIDESQIPDDVLNSYVDAKIDAITNEYGRIEFFEIINPGDNYTDAVTITVSDSDTGASYTIENSEFITIIDGKIMSVEMPQDVAGFSFPSYVYNGTIHFEEVSTGLTAISQIYVLEKMENINNGDICYSAPRAYTDNIGYTSKSIAATLIGNEYEMEENAFKVFNVDYTTDSLPFINIVGIDECILENIKSDQCSDSIRKIDYRNYSTAIGFNVMLSSENEGVFTNTLEIFEEIDGNKYEYAVLSLYGETEGEDERLKLALANFGISIGEAEQKIFRESPVNEELPDYKILNQKRKEMLLEYHNIFPYLGSYKGLVNMINYFGYGDCRLKEYWLNEDSSVHIKTKMRRTGNPFDLGKLHEFARRYNSKPSLKSSNAYDYLDDFEEPETVLPRFNESGVNVYSGSVTDIPNVVDGVVVGKIINENKVTEPVIKGRTVLVDTDAAAKVVKREIINDELKKIDSYDRQYSQVEIPMQLAKKGRDYTSEAMLQGEYWKKTNKFGLFYDIVREDGTYDEHGIPNTEDAFMFTESEIIVKLDALRKYLKNKFMPINARIVDIVGEGIYFSREGVNIWKNDCVNYTVDRSDNVSFSITSNTGDAKISDQHDYKEENAISTIENSLDVNLREIAKMHPFNFMHSIGFKNNEGAIGCKVKLSLGDFAVTWDEVQMTWDDLKDANWYNINSRDYVDIEWDVKYCPEAGDPRTFEWSDKGPIHAYTKTQVFEEYSQMCESLNNGDYNAYDVNNNLIFNEDIYKKNFSVTEVCDEYIPYEQDGEWSDDQFIADVNAAVYENGLQIGFFKIYYLEGDGELVTNSHVTNDVILPYAGKYLIQCTVWDYTNTPVSITKEYNVEMPKTDFYVFGRSYMEPTTTWDEANYSWDEACQQWRNPGKQNDVTWDDLAGVTWDDLSYSNYAYQEDAFDANVNGQLLQVSEKDRLVGKIKSVSKNTVLFDGCYNKPEMKAGETVIFRHVDAIQIATIHSISYDVKNNTTSITFEKLSGITTAWEALREVGGTILIKGDYTKSLEYGINAGKYLLFRNREYDDIKKHHILVDGVIKTNGVPTGIKLEEPVSKVRGEYGRLYERHTIELTPDNFNAEEKTFTPGVDLEDDEIVPGFTTIFVTSIKDGVEYKQRLIIKSVHKYVDEFGQTVQKIGTYDVVELDSTMDVMVDAESTAYWDYHTMTVKLSKYETEEIGKNISLNLNDYPFNKAFEDDAENWEDDDTHSIRWYFDYVIKDASFSVRVDSYSLIDGNTFMKLNDEYNELYQASPRFKCLWSSFDEEYAEIRYGTEIFNWDNFEEVSWDDCKHLSWNMLDYYEAPRCGFIITEISAGGRIQFNECNEYESHRKNVYKVFNPETKKFEEVSDDAFGEFQFKNVSGGNDWYTAVEELNTTTNWALSKFSYRIEEKTISIVGEDGEVIEDKYNTIVATAKNEGSQYLGYLIGTGVTFYDNREGSTNISHTYPIGRFEEWNDEYIYGLNNKYAKWHPVARAYYENGIKEAERDSNGNIIKKDIGWYPAARAFYQNPNVREDVAYKWNAETILNDMLNLKECSCLMTTKEEQADAERGKYTSLLNSVDWAYDNNARLLYDYAITSPFTWNDLIASNKEIEVNKMTTLFFAPTNSKIAGIKEYVWTLFRYNGTENEIVVKQKDNLIWTFTKDGHYNVNLDVVDINGNKSSVMKYGVVKVS